MAKLGPKIADRKPFASFEGIEVYIEIKKDELWLQIRQPSAIKWQITQTSFSTKDGDILFKLTESD